jgi:hypothetical protein
MLSRLKPPSRRPSAAAASSPFPARPGLATQLAALSEAEQRCCGFFQFQLTIDPATTRLQVTAPPEAADAVAELLGLSEEG